MVTCKPPSARYDTLRSGGQRGHGQDVAGLDLYVCPFTILVDTREQAPWTFQSIVIERRLWTITRIAATLATGDYTIAGCEDRLCVERKSVSDLIKSITVEHDREARKQARMRAIADAGGFARMIIEGSFSQACDDLDADEGRKVGSEHILGTWASWENRYVPWLWAGDRRRAELIAFKVMLKWWEKSHV